MRERIAVLGSTGSIGTNTLKVVASLKDSFEIIGLSADSNIELLSEQARAFKPKAICVKDVSLAAEIRKKIPSGVKTLSGMEGLNEIVTRSDVDLVVFAASGTASIIPLAEAVRKRKKIALANKESLVSAGHIIMGLAGRYGVKIIPIDSEHSAIFQCLDGRRDFLSRIYLTGSGGPLLNVPKERFDRLTREFVLKHPKWKMGRKISVDSATMMNKGLEIIEAKYLFDADEGSIEVLIHPEAIIHSMVELADGTVLAQMGSPDMRTPIQYAITYPSRLKSMAERIEFSRIKRLTFLKPDLNKFPCLKLAREAIGKGGAHPAALNAADEEAVRGYLDGVIRFSDIPRIVEKVLSRLKNRGDTVSSLDGVLAVDRWAKEEARRLCYR